MVRARGGSWCAQHSSAFCLHSPCISDNDNEEDDRDDSDASDLVTNKPVSGQGLSTTTITPAKPNNSKISNSFYNKSSEINRRLLSKRSTRNQKVVSYVEDGGESENDGNKPSSGVSHKSKQSKEYDKVIKDQSNCSASGIISETSAKKQAKRLLNCSTADCKKKQFKCKIEGCNRSYSKSYCLIDHLAKHQHGFDAKPFVCDFKGCDRRFGTRSGLYSHSLEHTDKFKCLVCEKQCRSKYELQVHRQSHTGEKLFFKCPIDGCDRQFNSRSTLTGHKAQHEGKYKCQECDKKFPTSSCLNIHLESHTGVKLTFKCSINNCDRQFSCRSSLFNHKAIHLGKYECKECGKQCRSMFVLKEHQRTLHTGEKPYKCKVEGCNRSYSTSNSLRKHSIEHKDTYRCQDCGKRCQSKMRLEDHRRSHDRDLQWKCDVKGCGRRFKSRNGFNDHKAQHTGIIQEKLFKCEVEGCGKEYDTRYGLILHNNEHQGKFFRRRHRKNNFIVKEKKLSKNLNKKPLKKKQSLTGDNNTSRRSGRIKKAAKRSPIKRASKEKAIENMRNQFNNETASEWDDDSSAFSSSFSPENSSTDDDVLAFNHCDIPTVESSSKLKTKSVHCPINLDNADAIDKANCLFIKNCSNDNSKGPTKQFKCNLKGCNRIFPTLFQLHRHKRRHQGRCRCKECYKRWKLKFNWNKHQRF